MNKAEIQVILVIQDMHEDLKSVQGTLEGITEKRKKEKKAKEEKEMNEDPSDKKQSVMDNYVPKYDQYEEEVKSLRVRERNLLEKIQVLLKK